MKKRIFKKKYGLLLTCVVKDSIDSRPCEFEIISVKTNQVVGYWAYGYYDPELPYQGEDFVKFKEWVAW